MGEREVVFYDCQDSEVLEHSDLDECVESYLDMLWPEPGNEQPENLLERLPKTITVRSFARMEPAFPDVLAWLLEVLDEEHAAPDGDATEPTPAMLAAEDAFLAVMRREYKVWNCEEVGSEEVDVAEWVRANHPEWLRG
jgi:hypothetical protein